MNRNWLGGLAIILVIGLGAYVFTRPVAPPFGAAPGGDFYNPVQFFSSAVFSYNLSTTTPASMTLKATDIVGYSTVTMKPTIGAITVTFPASSTLSSLVPSAGQLQKQCWYNATTTAASTITFVAGTGETFETASSTTGVASTRSLAIQGDDSACFEYQRKGGGPVPQDLIIRFTRYTLN